MIVRARDRLRYVDSLPEPQRSLAAMGVPEGEWPRYIDWIERAVTEATRMATTCLDAIEGVATEASTVKKAVANILVDLEQTA